MGFNSTFKGLIVVGSKHTDF